MQTDINIGEFDTPVTIQKVEVTIGTQGQKGESVTATYPAMGKVSRNADEMYSDGNLSSDDVVKLSCYKVSGINTRWRVSISGKVYGITDIDLISRDSRVQTLSLKAIN